MRSPWSAFSAACVAWAARGATAGFLTVPVLGAVTAWADTPAPPGPSAPPDPSSESAPFLAAQGVKLFRAHAYEAACEAFTRAYALDPQSETLLELGLAEVEAGHPVRASKHLREYLGRTDALETKRDAVRTHWLPRVEAQTAHVAVFAPAGAEVRIDGAVPEPEPATTPDPETPGAVPPTVVLVVAGEHDVTAQNGALVQSQHVVANVGERIEIHFPRGPDPTPPAAPAPAWTTPALVDRDRTPNSRARGIAVFGLESAAVVATGVAIGFSVAVENSASDANTLIGRVRMQTGGESGCLPPTPAPPCAQIARDRQDERNNAPLATGFYVGAGALAAIGAATFLAWPSRQETLGDTSHLVPLIDDRAAGAAWKGTW